MDFSVMERALRADKKAFPGCRIANCGCNSREGEWKNGCHCMCHFKEMDKMRGESKWTFTEFTSMSEMDPEDRK